MTEGAEFVSKQREFTGSSTSVVFETQRQKKTTQVFLGFMVYAEHVEFAKAQKKKQKKVKIYFSMSFTFTV